MAVVFDARIDRRGELGLVFEPVPATRAAILLQPGVELGKPVARLSLRGIGPEQETIESDSFELTSADGSTSILYEGVCARIRRSTATVAAKPQVIWWFRRLETFSRLLHDIAHGKVWLGGARPGEDEQALTGRAVIEAHEAVVDGTSWHTTAELVLEHVARVMSLAVGTYLRPFVELYIDGANHNIRVSRWTATEAPIFAPFSFLDLESIFRTACDSYEDRYEEIRARDPAIQWLLAGASYHEIRLIAVMTALENVIHTSGGTDALLSPSDEVWLSEKVGELIAERSLSAEIRSKIRELNRRSFRAKLREFIKTYEIAVDDFPRGWAQKLIEARNDVIHRGLYSRVESRPTQDIWEHIVVARELMTRILLRELRFRGNYDSILHGGAILSFPDCRRVS